MQVVIGLIQIAAGILIGFALMQEYREHGGMIVKARSHDEVASPAMHFLTVMLVVVLVGGGVYLLKPANLCGF